jgi:hypothetical protein
MRYSYSEEQLQEAVKTSFSISQVLSKLGIVCAGGNYKTVKHRIQSLKIDSSHFTGQGHLKGKTHNYVPPKSLDEVLVNNNFTYNSNHLRQRLIKEGLKEHRCECCKNTEWLGQLIPLELEHVNGVHSDNRIGNLKLLCPNCHAQTSTYRGKNKKP